MEDAHTKTVNEVLKYFDSDPERGLSAEQVSKNQEKYGPNGKCLSQAITETTVFLRFYDTEGA